MRKLWILRNYLSILIIGLSAGVVVLSVVTVVKRSNEPKDVFVSSNRNQSSMIGDVSEGTEATGVVEEAEMTAGTEPDEEQDTEATRTMYLQDTVNVRSGPGTDFPREGRLARNSEVTVIGESENGWQKIIYGDTEAYVSAEYLVKTAVDVVSEQTQPVQPEVTSEPIPAPQPESTPQPDTAPQPNPTPEPESTPENPPEQENPTDTPSQPEVPSADPLPGGEMTPAEPEIPPEE